MRKIDENKKEAITKAVFQLTKEIGLTGLSVAKVAKLAGVSPGTIYIYYKDKSDMLSQILMQVKDIMDDGMETAILSADDIFDQLENFLIYLIDKWTKYPEHSLFMRTALENTNEFGQEALEYCAENAKPLVDLYNRLIASGKVKAISQDLMVSWTAMSVANMILLHYQRGTKLSDSEISQMMELSIDAIRKR